MALDALETVKLTLTTAAPLLLAAVGGFTSERAGVINIALEGKMLMGAFAFYAAAMKFGAGAGLGFAVFVGIIMSLIHWWMTQKFRIDHVISGMAVNLLAAGASNFLLGITGSETLTDKQVPPLILLYVLAILSPIVAHIWSNYTKDGLRHRAVGSDPDKARLLGVDPLKVRFGALVVTGALCGLAGALLTSETAIFTDNLTSGRGYIALAALILGGWRPLPAFGACLLFGFASGIRVQLQGTAIAGAAIPSEVWKMLPYLVTLIALAGFMGKNRTPQGLGKY